MASGLDLTYLQRDDGGVDEPAAASSMGSIGFRANTSDTTNDTSYSNSRNEFAGDSSTGVGAEEEQQQDVYRTLYENPGAAQNYIVDGSEAGVAANGGGSAMGDVMQQQANDTAEQDNMRPWTELKTKAGKERKRLPLACIVCRRKKIRCSGEKPACKHCYRSRIPCVYKVTTRKAAPRTDYMAMLDKRLKRMEERVMKAIPKDEQRDMAGIGRATVKPHPPGQASRPARAALKKRTAAEAFSAELNEWTRPATANPIPPTTNTATTTATAPTNTASGEKDASISDMRSDLPPSLQPHINTEHKLLSQGAEFLPSMELQEHLAEVFFDCVYGQSYLLLHKPSFMRKLKTDAVPPVLILAICAVSARFSTHPQVNTEPAFLRGESWADAAADIALARHDQPNITILTVFLILGLHEFGACHGGRSWSFGGMALRMAYALQLHRELDRDPLGQGGNASELSCTDREIRRRTMWACILMDRYNSSGSQRPPIGNEKFLQIQLPIKESHFWREIPGPTEDLDGSVPNPVPEGVGQLSNPRNNMGISAYIIRGIMLWGKIVDYLNLGGKAKDPCRLWEPESGYNQLKRQLKEFSSSLPESLVFSWENLQNYAVEKIANQFIFLHIVIHQNTLFLNRFAIPLSPRGRPPRDIPKPFLSEAGRAAVEAASHISMLIDQASGYMLTVPFAGYCAYAASTVHIWGIFSKNPQLEAASKENFRHTYKYLNKMKRYWGMFHYMVESSKERYRHFAEASVRGRIAPGVNKDSKEQDVPIFQYGDWFDKYPHGVSKLRWEDPDVEVKKESGSDAVMAHQSDLQSVEEFFTSLSPVSPSGGPRKEAKRTDTTTPSDKARRQAATRSNTISQPSNVPSTQAPQPRIVPNSISPDQRQHQQPQMQPQMQPVPTTMSSQIQQQPEPMPNHVTADYSNYTNPNMYTHHTEPTPFSAPAYKFHTNPDPLPQLDRQLVYDAYIGVEAIPQHPIPTPSSNSHPIHSHHAPQPQPQAQPNHGPDPNMNNSYWNNNSYQSYEMQPPMNWNGELIQSSAWFLPFNLDPIAGGLDGDVSQSGAGAAPAMAGGPSHSPQHPAVSSGMSMGDGGYYGPPTMMHPVGMGLGMNESIPPNISETIRERVG
ncbi:zinc finger transcription factor 1 [Arthroderma uncinatum]|uniref:zinc finger transcription factor 1 n=1 Tax=Arthroderma uncinatum TaxID=74035 RepID=UPI00144AEBAE|nr:zinc finger transcription factor 1 [Arthroderma uncinatum]KAF3491671.1 zinc finger transcription factor 1 [Arthroderma uncinatum]